VRQARLSRCRAQSVYELHGAAALDCSGSRSKGEAGAVAIRILRETGANWRGICQGTICLTQLTFKGGSRKRLG